MNTYAKLKDGRVMIIVGEDHSKKFYYVMPKCYNVNVDIAEEIPYSEIVNIDTNLSIL